MMGLISLISSFVSKKGPLLSKTVGEASKSTSVGIMVAGYGIYVLSVDPSDKWGHFYLILSLLAWTLKKRK